MRFEDHLQFDSGHNAVLAGAFAFGTALALGTACHTLLAQGGLPHTITEPSDATDFGWVVRSGRDVNRDGHDDIFLIDPAWSDPQENFDGRFAMYSGQTFEVLWEVGDELKADDYAAAFVDDVNGDTHPDVVVSLFDDYYLGGDWGMLQIRSGLDGSLLRSLEFPPDTIRLGRDVAYIGDINDDNIGEVAAISRHDVPDGEVTIFDGQSLEELVSIDVEYPRRLSRMHDVSGDGLPDIVIGSFPEVFQPVGVYSTADGSLLMRPDVGQLNEYGGWFVSGGQDLTGDGVPDLLTSQLERQGQRRAILFSGVSGKVYRTYEDFGIGQLFGTMALSGNFAGDEAHEVLVATAQQAWVLDSRSGIVLRRFNRPDLGNLVTGNRAAVGDVNGDGFDDIILSGHDEVSIYGGAPLALDVFNDSDIPERPVTSIRRGATRQFRVTHGRPRNTIHLLYSLMGKECTYIPKLQMCIDLTAPVGQAATMRVNASGIADRDLTVPANTPLGPVWLQALDPNHSGNGTVKSNVLRIEIED